MGPALGEACCPSTNVAKVCERTRTFAGARLEKNGRLQETLQYGRRWARGGGEGSGDRRGPAGFSPDPTVWTRFKRVRGSLTYGRGQVFNTSVTSREPQTRRPWTGVTHFLPRPGVRKRGSFPGDVFGNSQSSCQNGGGAGGKAEASSRVHRARGSVCPTSPSYFSCPARFCTLRQAWRRSGPQ